MVKRKVIKTFRLLPVFVLVGLVLFNCSSAKDWRTASRASAGIAPDPAVTKRSGAACLWRQSLGLARLACYPYLDRYQAHR